MNVFPERMFPDSNNSKYDVDYMPFSAPYIPYNIWNTTSWSIQVGPYLSAAGWSIQVESQFRV